ncbi:MAG TPA: diadenylate cyclase CdaA [Candidatus Deferrimicrobium sp.]|nr:diadenylate cyclase CdaA [Candidatus Deferrimicrobium sp.]
MNQILMQFRAMSWISVVDIAVVAFVLYKLLMLIKGTRAVQLLKGLAVLLIVSNVAQFFDLYTVNWVLEQVWKMLIVALPVVFQPELRRALEQIGRGKFFTNSHRLATKQIRTQIIQEVVRCSQVMAKNRIGALIVFERDTGIQEWIETGIKVDGVVSSEFLINIFVPKAPLHDGAVIITADRVAAAGCFLPLSENPSLAKELGTRHRAAIGISEQSDALALVVSEETGAVSAAKDGLLTRNLDEKALVDLLERELQPSQVVTGSPLWRW